MKFSVAGDVELTHTDPDNHFHVGKVTLLGTDFHVGLVRVEIDDDDGLQGPSLEAPPFVHEAYDDMQRYYDGVYQTVEFPGLEGRFVMFIHPFAD